MPWIISNGKSYVEIIGNNQMITTAYIIQTLARELGESAQHVENVVRLLDEGNTIPFIAR